MSNRWIKAGLLVVTLGLPVALYLFLQGFGKNQYAVPIIYALDTAPMAEHCGNTIPVVIPQYSFTNNKQQQVNTEHLSSRLHVMGFASGSCPSLETSLEGIARISNKYRDDARMGAITLVLDSLYQTNAWQQLMTTYNLRADNWDLWHFTESTVTFVQCALNLDPKSCETTDRMILIDGQRRIRGYYQGNDSEDVDRLITEIEILLLNGEDGKARD